MKKFSKSVQYALQGIRYALLGSNFRIMVLMGCIAILFGAVLNISDLSWMIVVALIAVNLSFEMFNSCIEMICDFISPHHDTRIGRIKDMAAGAVLIIALASLVISAFIFIPKISQLCIH